VSAVYLTRVDEAGAVREQERTSSEPLGAGGVAVTTQLALQVGEVVWLVGNDVTGWASVTRTQPDGVALRAELQLLSAPPPGPAEVNPERERRAEERLVLKLGVDLSRLGSGGETLEQDRAVTENICPRGARVRTTLAGFRVGDRVALRERRGSFRTGAIVRGAYAGPDGMTRLNLEFDEPLALG
jgi:hypothetical protein